MTTIDANINIDGNDPERLASINAALARDEFAHAVSTLRLRLRLTQVELARRLGVPAGAVVRMEQGEF